MNNQKILITGASGKTGNAIISGLSLAGYSVTAFTHKESYRQELIGLGADQVLIGNLRDHEALSSALAEQDGIYHICPNMTPDELEIGKEIIRVCEQQAVHRFVYHSVLHPQIQSMNHHWQKLLVEEQLFQSSLKFTIIQPAVYMQNWLGYRAAISQGRFVMPYRVESCLSYLDLRDLGEAASIIFGNSSYIHGVYELVGTSPVSQESVARSFSDCMGKTVTAEESSREDWYKNAIQSGMSEYTRDTLLSMFEYYDRYGLCGSPSTLGSILGKQPRSVEQFIKEIFLTSQE
jgi:NAD(P)H dehydrogenase (quinone)